MRFSVECGLQNGLRLLLRTTDASTWHGYQLEEPYALIGTAENCNVRLSDDSIAPYHAYLQMLDNRLFACDLTESGGLLVDDSPVTADWVDQPAVIHLGRYELRTAAIEADKVRPAASSDRTGDAESQSSSARPERSLLVSAPGEENGISQPQSGREISLVGRSHACRFQLRSQAVSNFHCCLVRTRDSLWVVDLGSPYGTLLDGVRVKQARVHQGSRLTVGGIRLRVNIELGTLAKGNDSNVLLPVPATPSNVIQPAINAAGGFSEELIRDLVADVASSQQAAFEQARELLVEVLRNQQESHNQQLLSLKDQNAQLLDVIRMLAPSRDAVAPPARLPEPTPGATQQQAAAEGNQPKAAAADPAATSDRLPAGTAPPNEDPEVHEAWVRSQLHTISESLKKEQERGVKKLLRSLLPGGRSDDALR